MKNLKFLSVLAISLSLHATQDELSRTPASLLCDNSEKSNKIQELNARGIFLAENGKFDEAIESYLEAISLDPKFAEAWNNASLAFFKMGNRDIALITVNQALKLNPNLSEAHNNLGIFVLEKGNLELAQKAFKTAIQINPSYDKAYGNLVRTYLEQGKDELAFDCQKEASAHNNASSSFYILGELALKLKKYQEAIKAFEKARSLGDNRKEIISSLAYAYFVTGQTEKSAKLYQEAAVGAANIVGQDQEPVASLNGDTPLAKKRKKN